jgi:hypothetical protein
MCSPSSFEAEDQSARAWEVEWRREPLWAATRGDRVEMACHAVWPPWRKTACARVLHPVFLSDHFPCERSFLEPWEQRDGDFQEELRAC